MRNNSMADVHLDVEPRSKPRLAVERDDTPFRILVLADLGGSHHGEPRPIRIDRDDYDDVMRRVAPRAVLGLTLDGAPVIVGFSDYDEFHPDHLYATLPVFSRLRDLRDRLDDPATFARAARELLGDEEESGDDSDAGAAAPTPADVPAGQPPAPPSFRAGSLLDMMVDEAEDDPAEGGRPAVRPPRDELHEYIRSLVAPHIVPGEDPRRDALVARVDEAVGDVMRRVIHDPSFRTVSRSWRTLFMMVRRIATGPDLTIDVVDFPRASLEADQAGSDDPEQTTLYRLLVEHAAGTAGEAPWAVVVGDYTFGPSDQDAALLSRIASIAQQAGAPFIAAAHPTLAGLPGFADMPDPSVWEREESASWEALRQGGAARYVGLTLPRFLLRLPFGDGAEECDTFDFEELAGDSPHEGYLWGNSAYVCAIMLSESFSQVGWAMKPGMHRDLGGLPLHLARSGSETVAKPCAETLMTERAAARLIDLGLMPLASMKHADVVRLLRFQSIASPLQPLAGRWAR